MPTSLVRSRYVVLCLSTLLVALAHPLHGQADRAAGDAPLVQYPPDVMEDGLLCEFPVITAPPSPLRREWGPLQGLGRKVPDYRLEDPDRKPFRLTQLRGKVVVLDMWLPGCAPCLRGLPRLSALAQTYQGRAVAFVTVCCDAGADRQGYHGRAAQLVGLGLPMYADPSSDYSHDLRTAMSIRTPWPTQVIISRSGRVIGVLYGEDEAGQGTARLRHSIDLALTTTAGS